MKKGLKIVSVICAALVFCAVALGLTGVFGLVGYHYANAENYTAGPTEITAPVKNLDVDWTSGEVKIAYHSGAAVVLQETANKDLDPDTQLRWWLDGDTLRIRYEKEGFRLHWNLQKTLTVILPEGAALGNVSLAVTSGKLTVPALMADTLALSATSGRMDIDACARRITAGATSGDIVLRISGSAEEITAGATSGSIRLEAPAGCATVHVSTTSGSIHAAVKETADFSAASTSGGIEAVLGQAKAVKIGSTSGRIDVKAAAFDNLKIGATSGAVTVALPAELGFTARLSRTSGGLDYDLPLVKQGDVYLCGDGSASVEIGTTSGSIRLTALTE
ncbi:MAG: DUF4097 family beta strand repeat protein [Clostridia bacterium]|nr:DUF4097 family beta strand repeat protein [Clostridia bacterium]